LIDEHNFTFIHPYDDNHVIAGQGTTAWEFFDEVGDLDLLFVPVGGGGLISGCALAAAAKSPKCQVIGVEPERANDANRSWREGQIITLDTVPDTIADGLRPRHIGQRNLIIMRRYVNDMITVSEQAIVESLLYIWQRLKIVVETSAAVALAPILTGGIEARGLRIGIILSGGNVDLSELWYYRYPKSLKTGDEYG
jgi:threonine dehydratase